MKMKNFISLGLIISMIIVSGSRFIFSQTVQPETSTVYNVDPGTKGNKIIIELANTSKTTQAQNIKVKLIKSSKQLEFKEEEKSIEQIIQNKGANAEFNFDIKVTAPANVKDTIEFKITGNGINMTKSFILKYSAPKEFALYQNYPNPFNPTTTIRYSIPEAGSVPVNLKIYDILGREVETLVNKDQKAGNYEVEFNAGKYASGMYIYRLTAGNFKSIKKMMLVK
jgi:5-hydroxyisourate hydrolase-like protein (transthyretin family)